MAAALDLRPLQHARPGPGPPGPGFEGKVVQHTTAADEAFEQLREAAIEGPVLRIPLDAALESYTYKGARHDEWLSEAVAELFEEGCTPVLVLESGFARTAQALVDQGIPPTSITAGSMNALDYPAFVATASRHPALRSVRTFCCDVAAHCALVGKGNDPRQGGYKLVYLDPDQQPSNSIFRAMLSCVLQSRALAASARLVVQPTFRGVPLEEREAAALDMVRYVLGGAEAAGHRVEQAVRSIEDGPRTAYVFRLTGWQRGAIAIEERQHLSAWARQHRGGVEALLLKLRQPAPTGVLLQEALQLPDTCSSAEGLAWLVGAQLEWVRRNAQPEQHTYYFSQGGKKFHASRDCSGLNNGRRKYPTQQGSLADARVGRAPCKGPDCRARFKALGLLA